MRLRDVGELERYVAHQRSSPGPGPMSRNIRPAGIGAVL